MVEFNLKIHPEQRIGYFKREIVDQLGTNLKILSAGRAFVAYPEGEDPGIVIKSIEIIIEILRMKIDFPEEK